MVKYAFLVGRGWQLLPTFLSTKEAKTKTNVAVDMRYSMSSKVRISQNAIAIKQLCYDHNVYLYEEQLQININVFFFLWWQRSRSLSPSDQPYNRWTCSQSILL